MHDLLVAEICRPGAIFLPLIVCVYLDSLLHSEHRNMYLWQGSAKVTRDHRNWYQSKAYLRLPINLPFKLYAYYLLFPRYNDL